MATSRLGKYTFRLGGRQVEAISQGVAVVEPDTADGGFLVMLPNGDVERAKDAKKAERIIKAWAERDVKRRKVDAGVLRVEWR